MSFYVGRTALYRADWAGVVRLARWLGVDVGACDCPRCRGVLIEIVVRKINTARPARLR